MLEAASRPSRRLSVALIGVGGWGKCILQTLQRLPELDIVALVDVNPGRGVETGVVQRGLDAVLSDASIDVVLIATPEETHAELALRALDANKWVFVEKPLCVTAEEGYALARHKAARTHLMVGHLLQFDVAFRRLLRWQRGLALVATHGASHVQSITSRRWSLPGARPERNAWWTLAPHDLSVAQALWGPAQRVYLKQEENAITAQLTYAMGGRAELSLCTRAPRRERVFRALGHFGEYRVDDSEQRRVQLINSEQSVRSFDAGAPPLTRELNALVRGVNRGWLWPGVSQGLSVVLTLQAGSDSLREGKWVEVKHDASF